MVERNKRGNIGATCNFLKNHTYLLETKAYTFAYTLSEFQIANIRAFKEWNITPDLKQKTTTVLEKGAADIFLLTKCKT